MSEYFTRLKKIISEKMGIDKEEILENSYFGDDLNIGEMDLIDIISEIDDVYQVNLVEDVDSFETVQDVVDALEEQAE